jgi:hypothetical protein
MTHAHPLSLVRAAGPDRVQLRRRRDRIKRPPIRRALPTRQWGDYVFMRATRRGPHLEQWRHTRLPALVQRAPRHRDPRDHAAPRRASPTGGCRRERPESRACPPAAASTAPGPLGFRFNGRAAGHAGDTAGLGAARQRRALVGAASSTTARAGSRRGSEEPNALVQLGRRARTEPNPATQVELYDGLEARSQNRWPRVDFDLGAVNGWFSRLIPAGFYYKTFMWPRSAPGCTSTSASSAAPRAWAARRASPTPTATTSATPTATCWWSARGRRDSPPPRGRAGGARVILCRRAPAPAAACSGGPTIDGAPARSGRRVREELESLPGCGCCRAPPPSATTTTTSSRWLERVADHLPAAPAPHRPRQRLWRVRARQVVLATGAIERPLVFADNDRPGGDAGRRGGPTCAPLRRARGGAGGGVHQQRCRLRRRPGPACRRHTAWTVVDARGADGGRCGAAVREGHRGAAWPRGDARRSGRRGCAARWCMAINGADGRVAGTARAYGLRPARHVRRLHRRSTCMSQAGGRPALR